MPKVASPACMTGLFSYEELANFYFGSINVIIAYLSKISVINIFVITVLVFYNIPVSWSAYICETLIGFAGFLDCARSR